jgi:hypothetical protein
MLSIKATIISARTTFRSAMTDLFIFWLSELQTLHLSSVGPCVVDCQQTWFCKKKKKPTRLPKIIQKDQFLVSSKRKSSIITAVNWTFPKITSSKSTIQSKILRKQDNPNTTDIINTHFIISKKKILQR